MELPEIQNQPVGCRCGVRAHTRLLSRLDATHGAIPAQPCWPQMHGTFSVGSCLVNCCLQNGQGLVIVKVIALLLGWWMPQPLTSTSRRSQMRMPIFRYLLSGLL
jgi:hypothetical protein